MCLLSRLEVEAWVPSCSTVSISALSDIWIKSSLTVYVPYAPSLFSMPGLNLNLVLTTCGVPNSIGTNCRWTSVNDLLNLVFKVVKTWPNVFLSFNPLITSLSFSIPGLRDVRYLLSFLFAFSLIKSLYNPAL